MVIWVNLRAGVKEQLPHAGHKSCYRQIFSRIIAKDFLGNFEKGTEFSTGNNINTRAMPRWHIYVWGEDLWGDMDH